MKTIALNIVLEGKVQGVGYRNWVCNLALGMDINGWVANEYNGNVFLHAEGNEKAVEAFRNKCMKGPEGCQINSNTQILPSKVAGYDDFVVKQYENVCGKLSIQKQPSELEKKKIAKIEKLRQSFVSGSNYADTNYIYNRLLTFYDKILFTLGKVCESASDLSKALAADDKLRLIVCSDPVFRSITDNAVHSYFKEDNSNAISLFEKLAVAIIRNINTYGYVQSPVDYLGFGANQLREGNTIWRQSVWKEQIKGSDFQASSYFVKLFEEELASGVSSERAVLREINEEDERIILEGKKALDIICPILSADVLKHVRVIGIIDRLSTVAMPLGIRHNLCQNVSTHKVPGTIFLSPTPFRHPIHMAEAILHEGLHKKLSNIVSTMHIFKEGFSAAESKTIKAYWNPDLSWNSNDWSLDRALYAAHFYLHNAFYYLVLSGCVSSLNSKSYDMPKDLKIPSTYEKCVERANYLTNELVKLSDDLGTDGLDLVLWLEKLTQKLNN